MRIAVLWTAMSGYLNACLRELAARPGIDVMLAHQTAGPDAPFDDSQFSWVRSRTAYESRPDQATLLGSVRDFGPDVLLVNSWHISEFRHVVERLRPRPLRVLCMDNQFRGTWKQRIGVVVSPWYIGRLFDVAFLPGERQACFARRLGFADDRIWYGLLCPDSAALSPGDAEAAPPRPHTFGYLGRLTVEKGIQDLLSAYETVRLASPDPWALQVAGEGPLGSLLDGLVGVTKSGFVQPAKLNGWMSRIGCLVVPSRLEAWGVALSEAATAGLPIIATDACGAVPHLVHDFANGRIARTGDIGALAECLTYIAGRSDEERLQMGRISRGLASPYTPARWADTVLDGSSKLLPATAP